MPEFGLRNTVRQFAASAGTTWIEVVQQPVTVLLFLVSLILTILNPFFQFQRLAEEGRMARDSGLACLLVFGLVFAVTAAGARLDAEFRRGTAGVVFVKPISRRLFFFSKVAGIGLSVLLFCIVQTAVVLLAEKSAVHKAVFGLGTEYRYDPISFLCGLGGILGALAAAGFLHAARRCRFGVSFALLLLGLPVLCLFRTPDWRILPVAVVVSLLLVVFTVIASVCAVRLSAGLTGLICFALLGLGLATDAVLPHLPEIGKFVYGIVVPNVQNFWLPDRLARGGTLSWAYVGTAAGFVFTRGLLLCFLGSLLLRHREID